MAFEMTKYVTERDNDRKDKLTGFAVKVGDLLIENNDNTVKLIADGAVYADYVALEGTGVSNLDGPNGKVNRLNGVSGVFLPGYDSESTDVLVHKIRVGDRFIAPTLATSSDSHNGQRMVCDVTAGVITLDNTGTDAPTSKFRQVGVVGFASDKKVLVEVVE